jgi:hypothetical protein
MPEFRIRLEVSRKPDGRLLDPRSGKIPETRETIPASGILDPGSSGAGTGYSGKYPGIPGLPRNRESGSGNRNSGSGIREEDAVQGTDPVGQEKERDETPRSRRTLRPDFGPGIFPGTVFQLEKKHVAERRVLYKNCKVLRFP